MKPTVLIILDGWGYRREKAHNGVLLARTPHYSHTLSEWPWGLVDCSGPAVGLPKGVMGNSEVGHTNIGAGRIVYQGLSQIYAAIEDGSFFSNEALVGAVRASKRADGRLHLMGLLSDGAVHSHIDHLYALLELARREGQTEAFVHCFMDGRDTAPTCGRGYVEALGARCKTLGLGRIATVMGRYWAMDRDGRWERTARAYAALVGEEGERFARAAGVFKKYYAMPNANPVGYGDEFIPPAVIAGVSGGIRDGDAVIFFNFRADRARQITRALTDHSFDGFARPKVPELSGFACMMSYDETFRLPVAFRKGRLEHILPELLAERGIPQLRLAETEKYAHVTYFFNGGDEKVFDGEDRHLIPSARDVPTYDKKPQMSAAEITAECLRRLKKDYGFIVVNFANPDMVGHTAVEPAIIEAVECVDQCLGEIMTAVAGKGGNVIITADHGNCEETVDREGRPHTQHTTNPVPFVAIGEAFRGRTVRRGGRLCDIAPTLLQVMGIPKPVEMTGRSLLV